MTALRAIHAKRRQVASLKDEDTWRDFVEKHTGQRSTRGLNTRQEKAILTALDALTGTTRRQSKPIQGRYAPKLQALWIACWNLGLIQSPSNEALNTFAVGQSSVSHVNWVRDHEDAVSVIEALKKMLERKGVDWRKPLKSSPDYMSEPGYKIAIAQWQLIKMTPPWKGQGFHGALNSLGHARIAEMNSRDWIAVMNTFGETIRGEEVVTSS